MYSHCHCCALKTLCVSNILKRCVLKHLRLADLLVHKRWQVIGLPDSLILSARTKIRKSIPIQDSQVEAAPEMNFSLKRKFEMAASLIRGDGEAVNRQSIIEWLEDMGDAAERGPRSLLVKFNSKKSYTTEALIEVIILAGMLKSSSDLRDVLMVSLRLALPEWLEELQQKMDSKTFALPSASTVSRHRLTLDIGYCRLVSSYLENLLTSTDIAIWAMADSSFRGHREWLLQSYRLVTWENLERLTLLAEEIETILNGNGENKWKIPDLSHRMQGCLWEHVMVPLALGKGRLALEYKFTLVFHAFRVEATNWHMVEMLSNKIVSMTTDYGTEAGLATVPATNVDSLLAFWNKQSPRDEADDLPPREPLLSLEHALSVPGIMHQVSTMLSYVSWAMSYYGVWREACSHVGSFLCDRSCKDLMKSQLFDASTIDLYQPLDSFHTQWYEARFGSVVDFATNVVSLRGTIARCWSKEKLVGKAAKEHECDPKRLEAVDKAFLSQEWWGFSMIMVSLGGLVSELQYKGQSCPCHKPGVLDPSLDSTASSSYRFQSAVV